MLDSIGKVYTDGGRVWVEFNHNGKAGELGFKQDDPNLNVDLFRVGDYWMLNPFHFFLKVERQRVPELRFNV